MILGSHLERLPADEHEAFVDDVLAQLTQPVRANYVRLNILASTCSTRSSTVPRTSIQGGRSRSRNRCGHPPPQVLTVAQAVLHERDVVGWSAPSSA